MASAWTDGAPVATVVDGFASLEGRREWLKPQSATKLRVGQYGRRGGGGGEQGGHSETNILIHIAKMSDAWREVVGCRRGIVHSWLNTTGKRAFLDRRIVDMFFF